MVKMNSLDSSIYIDYVWTVWHSAIKRAGIIVHALTERWNNETISTLNVSGASSENKLALFEEQQLSHKATRC
jgi:hypothetical protein